MALQTNLLCTTQNNIANTTLDLKKIEQKNDCLIFDPTTHTKTCLKTTKQIVQIYKTRKTSQQKSDSHQQSQHQLVLIKTIQFEHALSRWKHQCHANPPAWHTFEWSSKTGTLLIDQKSQDLSISIPPVKMARIMQKWITIFCIDYDYIHKQSTMYQKFNRRDIHTLYFLRKYTSHKKCIVHFDAFLLQNISCNQPTSKNHNQNQNLLSPLAKLTVYWQTIVIFTKICANTYQT